MTGSTVLVVRVPRPIEDADACIEHIRRGLRDGILVLGADVKYSVETFPPLGAVEVVAEPVPSLGTAKPQTELPNILPAEGVSRPEPKPPAPPPRSSPCGCPRSRRWRRSRCARQSRCLLDRARLKSAGYTNG